MPLSLVLRLTLAVSDLLGMSLAGRYRQAPAVWPGLYNLFIDQPLKHCCQHLTPSLTVLIKLSW